MKVILQQAQILHTYGILWGRQINLNPDLSLKVHDILIERLYITKPKRKLVGLLQSLRKYCRVSESKSPHD